MKSMYLHCASIPHAAEVPNLINSEDLITARCWRERENLSDKLNSDDLRGLASWKYLTVGLLRSPYCGDRKITVK